MTLFCFHRGYEVTWILEKQDLISPHFPHATIIDAPLSNNLLDIILRAHPNTKTHQIFDCAQ